MTDQDKKPEYRIGLKWEDGIIGKLESHWCKRFPVKKLMLRGQATVFTSFSIRNLRLIDKLGPVHGNVFSIPISETGDCKSPPFFALRRLFTEYDKNLLAPPKFTPEAFTEWCTGRKGNKKKGEEDIEPHKAGVILRDELSKICYEKTQKQFGALFAYLCELWDCWIEGYRTRTYGYEGGFGVFVSLCGTSNEHFLKHLDDDFWIIGLGARALFVDEIEERNEIYGEDFFFGTWDDYERKAYNEVIKMMMEIESKKLMYVLLAPDSEKRWREYDYECHEQKKSEKDRFRRTLSSKKAQQALKLAMNYAASRMSIVKDNTLFITIEDMEMAIKDAEEYFDCAVRVVRKWEKLSREGYVEDKIPIAIKHLEEYVVIAATMGKGLASAREIRGYTGASNIRLCVRILDLGEDKGYFEVAAAMNDQGSLSDEEYKRFKPPRGYSPTVYRLTKVGWEYAKTLGVKVDVR